MDNPLGEYLPDWCSALSSLMVLLKRRKERSEDGGPPRQRSTIVRRPRQSRKPKVRRPLKRPFVLNRNDNAPRIDYLDHLIDTTIGELLEMTRDDFDYLHELIGPKIARMDTFLRRAVTSKERFIITLRYLATGESYNSMQKMFQVSKQLISRIIPEVCASLIEVLHDYVKLPQNKEEWLIVSREYENRWNFPHVIGAVDGKYVALKAPMYSDTEHNQTKNSFHVVLLGVLDANSNFMYVDIDSSDGALCYTKLNAMLENDELNIPEPEELEMFSSVKVPYMLLGDQGFPFRKHCIRPFDDPVSDGTIESNFNERHAIARTPVEKAFGMLYCKFKILQRPIVMDPAVARKIVLASVYLQNFMRRNCSAEDDDQFAPASVGSMLPIKHTPLKPTAELMEMRMFVANYLASN
ncbi:putative nuclease HARBI1 [Anopheles aquasalis]|uniref:putative nuclease HARBI1 n=1 Tax=Anopheles aquasalis TaxID=42839 RepID=UPI00215B5202|nr:putative nuclease HARBI1 [Anopheles aquasalis]